MEPKREYNQVKSFEIDFKGRMSLPALINNMQEAAWNSAEMLGASVASLQSKGISWVLRRFKLELERLPLHREHYSIESWPSGGQRSFVYRDYRVFDASDHCIARATSTWIVFDLESRRMIPIPDWLQGLIAIPRGKEALEIASGKIPLIKSAAKAYKFPIRWHDVDTNKHLSNVVYFQCALEGLSDQVLSEKSFRGMDLNFRSECSWGDQMLSFVESIGEGKFLHVLKRESDDKILANAQSYWD